jgi:hypothetical protein
MKTICGIFFLSATLLVACSSTERDWQHAITTNTVAAYQDFLDKHPNTAQSSAAHDHIAALQDEQAWTAARQANAPEALQNYINDHSAGIHVAEAKSLIASNERSMAWTAASSANTLEALQGFLQKYPQGPEADQAKARLAQISGYRVQLASLRSERSAEKVRDNLQGKYGDVLGSVIIVPGATDSVHIVRSAPMGEGEANNACAKLKKDHQNCEVIKDVNS